MSNVRLLPIGPAGIAAMREIANSGPREVNGVLIDAYSASAVVAIWDRINPANRSRLEAMSPYQAVEFCFSVINRQAA